MTKHHRLDLTSIQSAIQDDEPAHIVIIPELESTNDYFRRDLSYSVPSFCLAEQQTRGRGRFNRPWYSPPAQNIYCSCLYTFQKNISELTHLSLAVSVITLRVLRHYFSAPGLFIKWPNDILYRDKKLSGNLIEVYAQEKKHCTLIIGIGININMLANTSSSHLSQPWASLRQITGKYINRNELASLLINQLLRDLRDYHLHGFVNFSTEWREYNYLMGQKITLRCGDQEYHGIVHALDEHGRLQLLLANGEMKIFASGETTILKPDKNSLACQ